MEIGIGVKSDPIQYRYTYEWLFDLMKEQKVRYLQLGSFFELYMLEDSFFTDLRNLAERRGIEIRSCFTAHRELGGFFSLDPRLEKVAKKCYQRYIEIAALLGADFVGSNPGAIYRDSMQTKDAGIECYLQNMKELMEFASSRGIKGLTVEPMSCLAEPPTLPREIDYMMNILNKFYQDTPNERVPVYLCGDISHGYANKDGRVIHRHDELFEHQIPYMCEFHIKNTDSIYQNTFGFSLQEQQSGIIHLKNLKDQILRNASRWPINNPIGYLEIGGPKRGRDYSDRKLGDDLSRSLEAITKVFSFS
ncbi:hypothetical protein CMK22_06005 [Candidatus Poribacteria bacterium]|nr:hypothetical protein [Candidatus Poribacteria bacterium]